jgi:glutamate:Na+ symporter, ESS family
LLVAPRVFGKHWFENAIFTYGWNTGTIAFGVALLRVADPRGKNRVLADYGMAFIAIGPLEALLYTFVLAALAAGYLLQAGIVLLLLASVLTGLALYRARRAATTDLPR